jgi:ABC-type branched-subunit amino acid transport system substrate-binding protein
MRLDPWKHRALAALAACALTGCGSTVQMAATRSTEPGTTPDGLGVPAGQSGAPTAPAVPGVTATTPATAPTSAPGGTTPAAGPTTLPTTVPSSAPVSGFGYTAKEIFIGVAYDSTLSQELGGAGVGSASVGDQHAQVEAIVAELNARGGIAGRRVVPVFYDTKGMSSNNDPNTIAQAACAFWTQDHHVFAAMTYVVQMDNTALYGCLSKHHVVFVPLAGESQATFARYAPYLWSPAGTTPEAVAPLWASRLKALGWFSGWNTTVGDAAQGAPVIGMLYGNGLRNNQPELDTSFVAAVTKALKAQGYSVAESYSISNNQADLAAAVLRFRNSKVTHVIGDYSVVNFTTAAESQHYRPRYALSTFNGGVAMKLFATPGQMHGMVGIGWAPAGDVESDRDPGTPAEATCRATMQKHGQSTSVRLAWFAMTWACDTFSFLASAIPASGLVPQNLPAAAARLGSLPGSFTFRLSFRDGRPFGVAVARDAAYRDDCSCFVYLSTKDWPL